MGAKEEFLVALRAGDGGRALELLRDHRLPADLRDRAEDQESAPVLHHAIAHNLLDVAQQLIALGADIHATDALGFTALHRATSRDAVRMLTREGAEINRRSRVSNTTPLILATLNSHPAAVEELLTHAPMLDHVDAEGCSAAHYSATRLPECAYRLHRAGANFDLPNAAGETAREIFERHATARSLERTMRELEAMFGPAQGASVPPMPAAAPSPTAAPDAAYYGVIEAPAADRDFLASLGIVVAEYDPYVEGHPVQVSLDKAIDVIQYLQAFKYDFDLRPFDGVVPTIAEAAADPGRHSAYEAYLQFEAASAEGHGQAAAIREQLRDFLDSAKHTSVDYPNAAVPQEVSLSPGA